MTETITTQDRYDWYSKNYEKPVKKGLYNKICAELNQEVVEYLLKGEGNTFHFNSRLGHIGIYKFQRNIRIKDGKLIAPADWGKTNKLRKEGKLEKGKVVYITDNYFIGFKWVKQHCNVKGISAYKFKSSRTNGYQSTSGANNQLRQILKDPLNHFKFPFLSEK